jgi:hypothetical protein
MGDVIGVWCLRVSCIPWLGWGRLVWRREVRIGVWDRISRGVLSGRRDLGVENREVGIWFLMLYLVGGVRLAVCGRCLSDS